MATFDDFVGTWRADKGMPYSTHTFTWSPSGAGLSGAWIIEATMPPPSWAQGSLPKRIEMEFGEPTLDGDRLLLELKAPAEAAERAPKGGLGIMEFRLIGASEATFGAAIDKLPPEFAGLEHRPSIEGHRVRLTRYSPPVTISEPELTP